MKMGTAGGHLMYRMGSRNISCNCIGEPFSSEISEHFSAVLKAAETVLTTFEKDEAQGYRSKDRQFAIEVLSKALRSAEVHDCPCGGWDCTGAPEGPMHQCPHFR